MPKLFEGDVGSMIANKEKLLSQVIRDRRATPSFDGTPIPDADLKKILDAGLHAPSGYNMQPWRFIVVRSPEQKKRLRLASFNQAKVEEASVVIVACGDADGWRSGDLDEMLRLGKIGGMSESYAEQAKENIPGYLSNHPNMAMWLNRHVMIAFTHMLLMAEALGYDTAPMEGYEQEKVREVLKLPLSYHVVALLGIGHMKGPDKPNGGRFDMARVVFDEEYGKHMR
jgi:nitroreductase